MAVKSVRSEQVKISDMLEGFRLRNFFRSWVMMLIYYVPFIFLYIISPVFVSALSFLLMYSMTLLILRGYDGVAACRESAKIAIRRPFETLIVVAIYYFLTYLGIFALLIGTLVTIPLAEIFMTGVLFELMGEKSGEMEKEATELPGKEGLPSLAIE